MQKMARRPNKERGNHLEQESNRQRTMDGSDGGLHPAVDGQSLDEGGEGAVRIDLGAIPGVLAPQVDGLTTGPSRHQAITEHPHGSAGFYYTVTNPALVGWPLPHPHSSRQPTAISDRR